jgi:ketopantoate reductase
VVERRSERIAAAFRAAGAEARASADITADLWRKLAFISTMAGRPLGVELTGDDEARILGFVDSLAPGLKPSFLLDLESGEDSSFVSALS